MAIHVIGVFFNSSLPGWGGGHGGMGHLKMKPLPSEKQHPRNFFKLMKSETLEGFFPRLLKKLIIMDLPPSRSFYCAKGKITPSSSKNIKRISNKFKNIQCGRLLFWKSTLFRKSNLLESNYSN